MVFSLAPLLVIGVAVAARVYGPAAARGEVARQMSGLVGASAAGAIEETIRSTDRQHAGFLASAVSAVMLLFFYYSARILYLGAELSHVHAKAHDRN